MKYYVYVWKTPIEIKVKNTTILAGSPIYVGKGSGERAFKHLSEAQDDRYNELKSTAIDRIVNNGCKPEVLIYDEYDSETDAFREEARLISEYGRLIDRSGTLTNLTFGGEGMSGFNHSDEQKAKWSKMRKGVEPYNKGMKRPGIGGRKKGTVWSEEERRLRKEIAPDRDNSSFRTDEFRARMSEMWKEGFRTGRIKHPATGKKWYNNGKEQKYFEENYQPAGWVEGRLKQKTNNKKGLCWFNNGSVNKQFRTGEEPEEFVHGRITKKQ